eukprot:jgi/Ulvmu1/4189/UM019_0168.1
MQLRHLRKLPWAGMPSRQHHMRQCWRWWQRVAHAHAISAVSPCLSRCKEEQKHVVDVLRYVMHVIVTPNICVRIIDLIITQQTLNGARISPIRSRWGWAKRSIQMGYTAAGRDLVNFASPHGGQAQSRGQRDARRGGGGGASAFTEAATEGACGDSIKAWPSARRRAASVGPKLLRQHEYHCCTAGAVRRAGACASRGCLRRLFEIITEAVGCNGVWKEDGA